MEGGRARAWGRWLASSWGVLVLALVVLAGLAVRRSRESVPAAARIKPPPAASHVIPVSAPSSEPRSEFEAPRPKRRADALTDPSAVLLDATADFDTRSAAMRLLGKKARTDRQARHVLAEYAASGTDATTRREALAAVLRWGGDEEVSRFTDALMTGRDPAEVVWAARHLAGNGSKAAQDLFAQLAWNHPVAEVRHRVQEEQSGLFCAEHRLEPEER
ncbi:MAG: hypothetical protein HYY16_01870 [Planctomycetes bacterium]|nr:hypothetical protein [Planctomycetota bacterium]